MSVEKNWQFVDTNVLVYAHDASAGVKHERSKELIERLWETGEGCLSVQVLQEFHINVTRKVAKPLSLEASRQLILTLSAWRIHFPSIQSILDAIRIQARYNIPFWDAMIVASAYHLRCTLIWSEDLSPGQSYEGVTVVNPFLT